MMITLELGPEFQATLASMTGLGDRIARAASKGLGDAVIFGADHVGKNFLTGQLLKRHSSDLANATQGWKESEFEGIVGVKEGSAVENYKWQLGGGPDFTIYPTAGHRLLSIPMKDAQTGAGVLKSEYSGGLRDIEGGFFMKSGSRLFFVKRSGKTARSRLLFLFLMAPSVKAHPTDALAKGTLDAVDGMTQRIEDSIQKAIA